MNSIHKATPASLKLQGFAISLRYRVLMCNIQLTARQEMAMNLMAQELVKARDEKPDGAHSTQLDSSYAVGTQQ